MSVELENCERAEDNATRNFMTDRCKAPKLTPYRLVWRGARGGTPIIFPAYLGRRERFMLLSNSASRIL